MKYIYKKIFLAISLIASSGTTFGYNIGLLIVATGKYTTYVKPLLDSAEKYFMRGHNVTYFVFTDGEIPEQNNVVSIYQKRLAWPLATLMRIPTYVAHAERYHDMDYLFASDVDMLFVDDVGDEILSKLAGTQHPGFVGQRGSYETNQKSTAYVPKNKGEHYFCGAFYGGEKDAFLNMCRTITQDIETNFQNNLIALWHDESHVNHFFAFNPPAKVLSASYCFPDNKDFAKLWGIASLTPRIMCLTKDHAEMQTK